MNKSSLFTFLFLFIAAFSFGQDAITITGCTPGTTESCKGNSTPFIFKTYNETGDDNTNVVASISITPPSGGSASDITVTPTFSAGEITVEVTNITSGATAGDYTISMSLEDADGATNSSAGCGFSFDLGNTLIYTVGNLTVLEDLSDANNLSDQALSENGSIQMSEVFSNTSSTTTYTWTIDGTGLSILTGDGDSNSTTGITAGGATVSASYVTENISAGVTLVKVTITHTGGGTTGTFPVSISGDGPCGASASTSMATVVLPVEFTYIKANQIGNAVSVDWGTASELNNEAFYIERSTNGADFVTIGAKQGAGTSLEAIDYSFVDNAPANGTNYYRIRQVDLDGSMEYSEIVEVKVAKSNFAVNVNPTAASNEVQIVLGETFEQDLTVQIFDALGRAVMNTTINAGNNVLPVDVSAFQSGTYFIKLYNNTESITKTFVKL